jgi:hypothetical protein
MSTPVRQHERALDAIYRTIDRARATWRGVQVADGLLKVFLVVGGGLVAGFVADNLLHLPEPVRLGYAIALLVALLLMLARYVVYPLARPVTDEMVAAHIERAFPELDNRLINAVLFSNEEFHHPLTRRMAVSQIEGTAQDVGVRNLARPVDVASLGRWGRRALVLAAAAVLYGVFFTAYLGNAWVRFLHPYTYIPPITDTRLDVRPGDASVLQGGALAVEARVSGVLPEKAWLYVETSGGDRSSDTMAFEGNAFTYQFANVQRDFTYRIKAGDASTPRYRVTVRSRPTVTGLDLTYTYPAYTGLPEKTEANAAGDIRALVGTRVRLEVRADRPVRRGLVEATYLAMGEEKTAPVEQAALASAGERALRGELTVQRSGRYVIAVTDSEGVANTPVVRHIEAVPDAAPTVFFVEPARDVAVGPQAKVTVLAEAQDDFSLRGLQLFIQRRAGADWERLQSWPVRPGALTDREGATFDVAQLGLKIGDSLAYYMQANDGLRRGDEADPEGGAGRSRIYHVRVVEPELAGRSDAEARQALEDVIRKLIDMQKTNLSATTDMAGRAAGEGADRSDFEARADGLVGAEERIYETAGNAAVTYAGQANATVTDALGRIAADHVSSAVALLKALRAAATEAVPAAAQAAVEKESQVLALLQKLLEDPAAALAQAMEEKGAGEEVEKPLDDLAEGTATAEKLLKALKDFGEEQRKVIEMTNQLAQKPVDDFTDEDEKKLNEVLDTEKQWAKFFQEAASDLSKLPPQDFSLATQAKELLEVYSEVQQAVEEGEKKVIELAVPHEQAGLELADSIETNIEKWLMETKDNQLWSMEDPTEDVEVPMSELPDELQDLIGDLVESEEDMNNDVEDMTSGWMDSLDVGAGWDTTDGPISDMSAKGITGNRLPNTNEVGGRSGEGRTGKSSGEFVEEDATGKGGRQTPTRLTADPYEAGAVNDTSAEAPSGATGGGKVSGQGAEGLQGPIPPPLQQKLQRVAMKQQELIDHARRLDFGLEKYRAPRGRLPETIELMERQQAALKGGDLANFARQQRVILSNLREVKELADKQKQVVRDRSALLPKNVREEISSSQSETVPDQYREMVRNYFRALGGGDKEVRALAHSTRARRFVLALALCLPLAVVFAAPEKPADEAARADLLAPDGVPYDNADSFDAMQLKATSANLLPNGSFEAGRYWPYGWDATDGLTTFWAPGGTDGKLCLRIYTDVLDAQWKARDDEVRRAVALAGPDPQALPQSPVPAPPDRAETHPPYYDTVAGLHGVHYRTGYVPVVPGAIYRFSIDARTDDRTEGTPRVFVKGFFDQKMPTRDGVQVVRRDAYQAMMILDPCDSQWRRYVLVFHPSKSKSTLGGKPLKAEFLQVQIYGYWKPGNYYFDNARLEIVGKEEPEEKAAPVPQPAREEPGRPLGEEEFPVFRP